MSDIIEDLPKGPLDAYRSLAKFDWKKLRLVFDSEITLRIKAHIWNTLERDPLFRKPLETLPIDEQKRLAALQFHKVATYQFQPKDLGQSSYKARVRKLFFTEFFVLNFLIFL